MREPKVRRVTITDGRYHFPKVERLLRRGEILQITRHNKIFAKFIPASLIHRETKGEPKQATRISK